MSKATQRHHRASEIFAELCEAPIEVRLDQLELHCKGDDLLRNDIEQMLLAHDMAGDFLEKPAMGSSFGLGDAEQYAESEQIDPYVGRAIGQCNVERLIARGGMSSVYAARQSSPDRLVALKIMRRSIVSRLAMKRFAFETQLLARLHHPGIAQVYATGVHEEEGWKTPFFVMELVPEARSITEYAKAEQFDTRQKLELLAEVCDAVQAGHRLGIIHRDLKPSNILVDGDGRVKVIDFGVARSTDSDLAVTTQLTETGQLIGTLQYMSPEQCSGDPNVIDTRSDVFALGVVLHELLLGATPTECDGLSLLGALERKRTDGFADHIDPNRVLPKRLRAILHTAMAVTPDRRYETAAAMATDLRAFCNGEPIAAAEPGAWERLARRIARHPIATTAVVCVLLIISTVALTRLSVWVITSRPDTVIVDGNGLSAHIVTLGGNRIKSWRGNGSRLYELAEPIEVPDSLGGSRNVALGLRNLQGTDYNGELVLFKWGDFENPIWTSGRGAPGIEAPDNHPLVNHQTDTYSVEWAIVADIFPKSPGDEIAVVHNLLQFSRMCIRVYRCDGTILFEAWHDGELGGGAWIPSEGLLVFGGYNSWADYEDRGKPIPEIQKTRQTPRVVFAIKPELGMKHSWIEGAGPNPTLKPEWYRALSPAEMVSNLDVNNPHTFQLDSDRNGIPNLIWSLRPAFPDQEQGILKIHLDASGSIIRARATDKLKDFIADYRADFDITTIDLVPLPPIITTSPVGAGEGGYVPLEANFVQD